MGTPLVGRSLFRSSPLTESLEQASDCSEPVQTTPEKIENGGFTPKTHQMFFVFPKKLKNASPITGHLGFVFEENSVFKMFSVHTKTKGQRFQIHPV